jgi:transcriptional regulator with XRE-family HTH domain
MNNKGYSRKFAAANKQADQSHIGVQLGRICIDKDIPVPDVAEYLGVSRQAVYMWFLGKSFPHPQMRETLKELVKTLKAKQSK